MRQVVEPIELPRRVLERVGKVFEFHTASKISKGTVPEAIDPTTRPESEWHFDGAPGVELPRLRMAADAPTLDVLDRGREALAPGLRRAPQDLTALGSWLELAYGVTGSVKTATGVRHLRACPSGGALYPCEMYVAAFAVEGLEGGLYHYSPVQGSLSRLRGGPETLARLLRGRPDLAVLKQSPGALLISTVYARAAWKYGLRGYRYALLDAGHLLGNVAAAAGALGIGIDVRLKVSESAMRELIGVADQPQLAESVQAMVIWAERAQGAPATAAEASMDRMPPIRRPSAADAPAHALMGEAHEACTAPGVAVHDVKPPVTEISVLPEDVPGIGLPAEGLAASLPLERVLAARRSARSFSRRPVTSEQLGALGRAAFRSGTFDPLHPSGRHTALVRPFWFIRRCEGIEAGLWYHDVVTDAWSLIRAGDFHVQCRHLCLGQRPAGKAAATVFLMANLGTAMAKAGPDAYRLALLESGLAAERIMLAATSLRLASTPLGDFYDDEVRRFLGLLQTGWEPLHAVCVGHLTEAT
jgi:SagB-type dehydrogenase family enzyme